MKKHTLLIFAAVILSACAGTPVELNRATFDNKKIETIYIPKEKTRLTVVQSDASAAAAGAGLIGAIIVGSIDANTNSKRNTKLAPVLDAIRDYDPATFLTETLQTEVQGSAFSAPLNVQPYSKSEESPALKPLLTPTYLVLPDYSQVIISLSVSMKQLGENGGYFSNNYSSSQQNKKEGDENTKRQHWIDNPNELIHQIQAGIYEVVQRFAVDFNGVETAIKPYTLTEPVIVKTRKVQLVPPSQTDNTPGANTSEREQGTIETNHPEIVSSILSPDTMTMRTAAIKAGKEKLYHDSGIIAASITVLERNAEQGVGAKDKFLIDGLSWSALNLGNARAAQSKPILSKIADSDLPKKLRNHAKHAIKVIDGKAKVK